jgi:hypothetical protein
MEAAVKEHLSLMVYGLAKRGYEYRGGEVEVRGPMPHFEFSEDATPDRGPAAQPNPLDVRAMEAFERAEKARTAKKAGMNVPIDDYELVTTFERKIPGGMQTLTSCLGSR